MSDLLETSRRDVKNGSNCTRQRRDDLDDTTMVQREKVGEEQRAYLKHVASIPDNRVDPFRCLDANCLASSCGVIGSTIPEEVVGL